MNILVCFKVVADLDTMIESDWIIDKNNDIDLSFIKTRLNCFDESGLEMVLKLSDLSESFNTLLNLTALTIGDERSDAYLKNIYALKYNKAVRINCNENFKYNPNAIAYIISKYVKRFNKQDVIIMGNQSSEGDNGQTPLLTAEILGWECITQVIEMQLTGKPNQLKIKRQVDGGYIVQTVKLPAVLSVGNSPNTCMRIPTLKDKMQTSKKEIEIFNLNDFGGNIELYKQKSDRNLVNLSRLKNERKCIFINGKDAKEKAEILFEKYLKVRLEK